MCTNKVFRPVFYHVFLPSMYTFYVRCFELNILHQYVWARLQESKCSKRASSQLYEIPLHNSFMKIIAFLPPEFFSLHSANVTNLLACLMLLFCGPQANPSIVEFPVAASF